MKRQFLKLLIYILCFCIKYINSSADRKQYFGKCVYLSKNTGSKIINFYKYKNKEYLPKNDNFYINLCNDTQYEKFVNGTVKMGFDSQVAYKSGNNNSFRLAGPFLSLRNQSWKDIVIVDKIEGKDIYKYNPQFGDFCDGSNKINYSISIIFEHKDFDEKKIEISEYPDINNCTPVLKFNFNKEYATDYLLLQKVLNDLYIFTGIAFILLGIYLCFLSFHFQSITKIIISIIFGQLIMFNIALIFVDNSTALKDYFCILIIFLGLVIGAPLIYFTRSIEKLYFITLSFSSGYVGGVFIYEIFFYNCISALAKPILIDVFLISVTSFIGLNLIIPRIAIYYPPFIGSYILIRGFSLFIYNATDKGGFGDLHLLIYLIKYGEIDLVEEYFENDYKYFYIYLIFIGILLVVSEVIIFFLNKNEIEINYSELEDEDSTEVSFQSMNKLVEK